MRMPTAARRVVESLLQRSIVGVLLCALYGVASFLIDDGAAIVVGAGALFFAVGGLCAALLIFSWRHYHPYWSWLIWAVPGPALIVGLFEAFASPLVASGHVSVLAAMLAVTACVGCGLFGALVVLRRHIKRWVGP